jgi:hypothetical protein
MKKRLLSAVLPALIVLSASLPALAQGGGEVLTKLGVNQAAAREEIIRALTSGTAFNEAAFKAFKALAPAARASLVKAGLAWIKAYTAAADFKTDYAKYREEQKPSPPEAVPSADEFLKKQRLEMEKQIADMRKAAAGMDAATRKGMEDGIKQLTAQIEAMEKDPAQRAQLKEMLDVQRAQAKADQETALAEWNKRTPADPKTLIADRIREFLETSADVDFSAVLVKKGTHMRFANEDYESKPNQWKLCFRAGKEAVEAARAFAEAWLAELIK